MLLFLLPTYYLPPYNLSIYLVITYIYMWDLPNTKWVTKVKPNINSVGVHLLLSHNGHRVGGRWFTLDQPVSAVPFENLFN
jgi:hypothetical protein